MNKPRETILITGASSGIGYQAAIRLMNHSNDLILPCRNKETAINTFNRLKLSDERNVKNVSTPVVDLSNLRSVKQFANELSALNKSLDAVVLNAGLQYTGSEIPRWSQDGIELSFAVNHLSHQYLTQQILPLLVHSNSPKIIITSSEVHNPKSSGGKIGQKAHLGQLEGLRTGKGFLMLDGSREFNADKAYKDSKVCNILFPGGTLIA